MHIVVYCAVTRLHYRMTLKIEYNYYVTKQPHTLYCFITAFMIISSEYKKKYFSVILQSL